MADSGVFHIIKEGIVYELGEEPRGRIYHHRSGTPGCISFGETIDEALSMVIREAMELWLEVAREQGLT